MSVADDPFSYHVFLLYDCLSNLVLFPTVFFSSINFFILVFTHLILSTFYLNCEPPSSFLMFYIFFSVNRNQLYYIMAESGGEGLRI